MSLPHPLHLRSLSRRGGRLATRTRFTDRLTQSRGLQVVLSPGAPFIRVRKDAIAWWCRREGRSRDEHRRQDGLGLVGPGAVPRQRRIAGTATLTTEDTGGAPTCFVLQAQVAGATFGSTDVLCGIPGISTLR